VRCSKLLFGKMVLGSLASRVIQERALGNFVGE